MRRAGEYRLDRSLGAVFGGRVIEVLLDLACVIFSRSIQLDHDEIFLVGSQHFGARSSEDEQAGAFDAVNEHSLPLDAYVTLWSPYVQ